MRIKIYGHFRLCGGERGCYKKEKGVGNQQHVKLTAEHKEGLDSDKGMVEVRL